MDIFPARLGLGGVVGIHAKACFRRRAGHLVCLTIDLHPQQTFEEIEIGDWKRAFIKKRRDDGKLDLQLTPIGRQKYEEGAERILASLAEAKFLPLHDKSSPEEIRGSLGMSKKHFKQSIGQLFKAGRIRLLDNGIELIG